MPDSTGAEQDGATQTVDKARFDGLMSAYQKEKARADALEKRFEAGGSSDPDDDAGAQTEAGEEPDEDSQQTDEPEFEVGGQYEWNGQEFVPFEPPTPQTHNESRTASKPRESSIADMRSGLDRIVGKPSVTRGQWNLD
jgi:hypothetical protein